VFHIADTTYEPGKCGFTRVATTELLRFHSPQYPEQYPSNIECNWLIISDQPNTPVEVTIEDLNVEECCDGLEVCYYSKLLKQNKGLYQFYLLWLPRCLKNVQNETTKRFLVGNTKINILTNQG